MRLPKRQKAAVDASSRFFLDRASNEGSGDQPGSIPF